MVLYCYFAPPASLCCQHFVGLWRWMAYHGESVITVNVVGTGGKLLVGKATDSGAELVLLIGQTGNVGIVGGEAAGGHGADTGLALFFAINEYWEMGGD